MQNLKKYKALSWGVVLFWTTVTVMSVLNLDGVRLNYDMEKFFPEGDNDYSFYMEFRDKFGHDNDFILIGIEINSGILNEEFLGKVQSVTQKLTDLPNVEEVISPTTIKETVLGPLGMPIQYPLLHLKQDKFSSDSLKLIGNQQVMNTLVSSDFNAVNITVMHSVGLTKKASDSLYHSITKIIDQAVFEKVHYGGRIPSMNYVVDKMGKELAFFMAISFVLLVIILIVIYRSFLGVVLPILIVLPSMIILLGLMILVDEPLNLVMTILPVVMFVVGTSDVVHILSRYSTEKQKLNNWFEALKITLKEVGLATLLTSVTTAIGFATLSTAGIEPVQKFGIVMAVGVMVAFVVAFTLLPSILVLLGDKWQSDEKTERINMPTSGYQYLWSNKVKVFLGSVLVIVLCGFGIKQLDINNYLLDDLKASDPHMQDFLFFENKFAGVRPFELAIEAKGDYSLTDYEVLKELDKLETYLTDSFALNNIISPLTFYKSLNKSVNGAKNDYYKLPPLKTLESNKALLKRLKKNKIWFSYVDTTETQGRLSGKIKDEGRIVVDDKINDLQNFISSYLNKNLIDVNVTGTAQLIDKNATHLADNMMQGLMLAFAVISIIVALLFRSLRMVVLSLIPNMLPLVVVAGIMGLVGIDLKPSTIIIFSISFGIAVDDTIHFLSKFKLELAKGVSLDEAVANTWYSTGKAIVITSIILLAGFILLVFSDFKSTYYIGLLISITLFVAVVADLILLPVLIRQFYKKD